MLTFWRDCDITSGFGSPGSVLLKALLKYEEERWFLRTMNHLEFSANFTGLPFNLLYINKFLKLSRFTVFLDCMLLVLKDL